VHAAQRHARDRIGHACAVLPPAALPSSMLVPRPTKQRPWTKERRFTLSTSFPYVRLQLLRLRRHEAGEIQVHGQAREGLRLTSTTHGAGIPKGVRAMVMTRSRWLISQKRLPDESGWCRSACRARGSHFFKLCIASVVNAGQACLSSSSFHLSGIRPPRVSASVLLIVLN
jgi:hypothetical protein